MSADTATARQALTELVDGMPFGTIDDLWRGLHFEAGDEFVEVNVLCKHGTPVVVAVTSELPAESVCGECEVETCGPCTRGEPCDVHPMEADA